MQGQGGAVWDMDVPDPASQAGELFLYQLESGAIVIVDGDAPEVPQVAPAPEPVSGEIAAALALVGEVPDGNADEVLAWAEDDPDRQLAALMVEQGDGGKGRKGVVESLTSDLENDEG